MKKKILSLFLTIIMFILLCPIGRNVYADSGYYGKFYYTISNNQVTIADYDDSATGYVTIPSTINGYPVTKIGRYAFSACYDITGVTIPDSVTRIEECAFLYSGIQKVVLGNNIEYIERDAFNVSSLSNVYIKDLKAYSNITFANEKSSPTYTGDNLYLNNKLLTDVIIPEDMHKIPDYMFRLNKNIKSITFSNSISIGKEAFYYCSVKEIVFPEYVSSINYAAFYGADINKIIFEKGVGYIGEWAFRDSNITTIDFGGSIPALGDDVFYDSAYYKNANNWTGGCLYIDDCLIKCKNQSEITLKSNTKYVAADAFENCITTQKFNVNDDDNYFSIDNDGVLYNKTKSILYRYPSGLAKSSYEIHSTCTTINQYAFYNSKLKELIIHKNLNYIKEYAFYLCSLNKVYFNGKDSEWNISVNSNNTAFINATKYYFYYVTFKDVNDNIISVIKNTANMPLELSKAPTIEGYTLNAYTDKQKNCRYDINKNITENIELYFDNIINQYTYKFVNDDGTVISEQTVDYGTQISPPNEIPTKPADDQYSYTFSEWGGYSEGITQAAEDMVFTAKYTSTVNQYTYKFVDEDGTVLKEETIDYGAEIVPPENPSKESTAQYNYTFTGWDGYTEGMTQTAEELVFYATYSVATNKYTYKFVDEDGTVLKEKTVNYNTMITAPTSPTKDATAQYTYTFEKWDGFTLGMKITQDVTFTAVYNATTNRYTYKFVEEDGSTIEEKTIDYGTEIVAPDIVLDKAPTDKYTYTHTGWNGYTSGMTITENITFTPIFDSVINKYSYKFVDEDGTVLKEDTVDFDTVITAPKNPTKEATQQYTYAFIGWDGFDEGTTQKAEAMVFTAKYSEAVNKYTYKFVDDNGETLKELTVDYGTEIVPPQNPSKAATDKYTYTFSKWNGYSTGMTVTDNITFTAEYSAEINKYTYKFIDHDGSVVKSGTLDYGTVIPTPVSPDSYSDQQYTYVFASWKGYVKGTKITKDVEFTARYSPIINQYTYVFVDENGNTLAEETMDYGTEIIAPDAPQKPSTDKYTYVFSGWNGYTDGMTLTDDVVFTPIYTPVINKYTYKFVDDDGSVIEENTIEYDSVITAPTDPVKKATQQYTYTFIGWEGFNTGITQTAETMVFTAKYSAETNKYTYKFLDEDGKTLKEENVDYGTKIILPENPTKASTAQYSYTFTGWNGYSEGMTLIDDVTFTAVYSPIINKYTYKFVDKDGTALKEDTVDYGTTVIPPETPVDKAQYTFDYWENYTDNMVIESDIVFNAIYKYKKYTITISELEKSQEVTYGDSYTLPIQEIKDFVFKGYYTEENGKGVKLTDENGKSIENYAFAENKTVYPYYVHAFTNKVMITGTDNTQQGTENVLQTVAFATDKNAKSLTCTVKYPEKFKLKVVSKDFVLANINSVETKDGYNYAYLTCMYDYAGNSVPTNQTITPFELSFAVEKDMALGEAEIEVCDIVLRGNENYSLEETATKIITILPKLAEGIAITGADTIDKATEFTATITPDYTYSKEVVWSVDDDKIAVISKDGILTPLKNGVVTITATTTDGSNISATKQVDVTAYAKIEALSITGVWDKEFSPDVNEYIVYVKEDVNNITVEADYTAGALFVDNVMLLPDMENDFELKENSTILTFKRNNVADMTDSEYKIKIVKFEGTKTTVSEDGKIFTVKPINIDNGTVILAFYNGDTFVEMQSKPYTGEDIPFSTGKAYTSVKVMAWNNLESMTPICDVEIVNTESNR